MDSYYCQPCKNQEKEVEADHWCQNCEECLCSICYDYHKALKITKDHKIFSILDYTSISRLLDNINEKCKDHPENDVEYFCSDHDLVCCFSCKNNFHSSCEHIHRTDETASEVKIESIFNSYDLLLNTFEKIINSRFENIKELDQKRENFQIELAKSRREIISLFDALESSLKEKFDKEWNSKHTELEIQMQYLEKQSARVTEKRNLFSKVVALNALPSTKLFLVVKELEKQNQNKSEEMKSFAKSIKDVICEYKITYQPISVCDQISFHFSPCKDLNDLFQSGSINEEVATKFNESQAPVKNMSSRTSTVESATNSAGKCQQSGSIKYDKECVGNKERQKVSQTTQESKKTDKFSYQSHFFIMKKRWEVSVGCIRIMTNGDLIMCESSQPRLMIYQRSGFKLGEVFLKYIPHSIAVINKTQVAATALKAIVVVDVPKISINKIILMEEICLGIAFLNNTFVVNCDYSGLNVVNLSGAVINRIPFAREELHLCIGSSNCIVSVKHGSEFVFFFNVSDCHLKQSRCAGLIAASGITSDDQANIYVTCFQTNKVHMLKANTDRWFCILDYTDGIDRPCGIDFDRVHKVLCVINKGGKSIDFFRKKL